MLEVRMPVVRGNQARNDGSLPQTLEAFMRQYKPEAAYFCPHEGKRTAIFVFDLPDPSHIATVAEIFFDAVEAEVSFTPVMTAEDLRTGLRRGAR